MSVWVTSPLGLTPFCVSIAPCRKSPGPPHWPRHRFPVLAPSPAYGCSLGSSHTPLLDLSLARVLSHSLGTLVLPFPPLGPQGTFMAQALHFSGPSSDVALSVGFSEKMLSKRAARMTPYPSYSYPPVCEMLCPCPPPPSHATGVGWY